MLLVIPMLAALCSVSLHLMLGRPRYLTKSAPGRADSRISIIIPARDEAHNIGLLLASIRNQTTAPHEVLVVDDGSTDNTADLARENGARVVTPPQAPDDWKGKTWACQQGADAATGDHLLFLDADTRLEPGAIEKFLHLANDSKRVHSVCPHHTVEQPYEQLSAFFNVIMIAGINSFGTLPPAPGGPALFGQCMLISRENYDRVGGHSSVRNEILENFRLAARLETLGIPRENLLGRGTITMRMFPDGFRSLWSSWKKGFTAAAGQVAPRTLFLSSAWLTGAMFAVVGIGLALMPSAGLIYRIAAVAVYLLYAIQCHRAFRLAGTYSIANAFYFPLGLLFYQTLFFTAVVGRRLGIKNQWKGRDVD